MKKIEQIKKYYQERKKVLSVLKSCETDKHVEVAKNYLKVFKKKWSDLLERDLSMCIKHNIFEEYFYDTIRSMNYRMV